MIANQAKQKWIITGLLFLIMTCLIALYTYLKNSGRYMNRSMQLVMKQMGHNLLIIPKSVSAADIYRCTDDQKLFPENITHRMAGHASLYSKYYVSILQKLAAVNGEDVIVTGIEPVRRPDETKEKSNPVKPVKAGTARLGIEAARVLNASCGKSFTLLGKTFSAVRIIPEKGSLDDCRIYLNLKECQSLLGTGPVIHYILSFECLHAGSLAKVEKEQRAMLERLFPEFRQITKMDIARGRYRARMTTRMYLKYLLMLIFGATVITIIITGLQEVRERKRETGLLVSIGSGYFYIAGLYITKILVIALLASVAGFIIGSYLSVSLVAPFAVTKTRQVAVIWSHLPPVVILACLLAVAAESIPLIMLVRMDPSVILMEE